MDIKRLWHSIRLMTIFNSKKRGDYVRRKNLFAQCGENVRLPNMLLPLYPNLISVGDNVEIASGVRFVTHDAIHGVLNAKFNTTSFQEYVGKITIGNNVFVGGNTLILGGCKIGSDVVIGACSLVNRNVPQGTVWAGVPIRQIGTFNQLVEKRKNIKP